MTREQFINILNEKGYSYDIKDNGTIRILSGDSKNIVDLESIESMPSDVEFTRTCGGVRLYKLKEIPSRVYFNNKSYVNLRDLEYIHTDVEFNNLAMVHLDSLKELTPNIKIYNDGYVNAKKVERISPDFEFHNTAQIYLSRFYTTTWGYSVAGISDARMVNLAIKKGLLQY